MIINESAVQTFLKNNQLIQYLKAKRYNEVILTDYVVDFLNKNKKTICFDVVFVDVFISLQSVGMKITFGSCYSYYNKLLHEGFENHSKKITSYNQLPRAINYDHNITLDKYKNVPDKLPGTNDSKLTEFFSSTKPIREFSYVKYLLHFSLDSSNISIKKVNVRDLFG